LANRFRREAAKEHSPGRQPWEDMDLIEKPWRAAESGALSGLSNTINSDPGLTPWSDMCAPLRG